MASVHASSLLGRAVITTTDGSYYLLDVEAPDTAANCPPTFLDILHAMAPDVSTTHTDEVPPFHTTYRSLERAWKRERTATVALFALDGQMPAAVRATAARLADELLSDPEYAFSAHARLSSAPLAADVDYDGASVPGGAFHAFVSLLRERQAAIRIATDTWARARVRVAEYSSWAAQLRETATRLGAFLAMSEAIAAGRPGDFDTWLTDVFREHPEVGSSDLLRLLIAWKEEALALAAPTQPIIAIVTATPDQPDVASRPRPAQQPGAASPEGDLAKRIAHFLQSLDTGALSPHDILSTFTHLAPAWLEAEARTQHRSLRDMVSDVFRTGQLNVAGASELADQQRRFPRLREVWVLARHPLDLQDNFYSIVKHNVGERHVTYYYFLPTTHDFVELRDRLIRDLRDPAHVAEHVRCITVPSLVFITTQGLGLLIPENIDEMQGVLVTSLTSEGKIEVAQAMQPSQVRHAYLQLRPLVETQYGRTLPTLPHEPSITDPAWEEINKLSERIN